MTPEEREAARHLLAHYNVPGYPRAGSFTTKLIECMEVADPSNRARLLLAFPAFRLPLSVLQTLGHEELVKLIEKDRKKVRRG